MMTCELANTDRYNDSLMRLYLRFGSSGFFFGLSMVIHSLKPTAKATENRPGPKRKWIIFQSLIFRGYVSFREGSCKDSTQRKKVRKCPSKVKTEESWCQISFWLPPVKATNDGRKDLKLKFAPKIKKNVYTHFVPKIHYNQIEYEEKMFILVSITWVSRRIRIQVSNILYFLTSLLST